MLSAIAAAFAGATGCGAMPVPPREPTAGSFHFKVASYNVHRDRSNDRGTVDAVGGSDADVVCLQETTAAWVSALRERYAEAYPYMIFDPKENAGGLSVLSRFPLEDGELLEVPGDWHPAKVFVVKTPAGPVQVLHVHLRSLFNGNSNWVSNFVSAGRDHVWEMELFWPKLESDLPTLVVGDFNESPRGSAVRWLEARGFQNALPMFRPGQFTWRGPSVASTFDMTIDHVLFDESFVPLDAWVRRSGNSDHLPVVAHLELPAVSAALEPATEAEYREFRAGSTPVRALTATPSSAPPREEHADALPCVESPSCTDGSSFRQSTK